jgi:hypothetical protein
LVKTEPNRTDQSPSQDVGFVISRGNCTSINQKLEEYLPPAILELQRDEIHQYVFYNALQVSQEVIDEFGEVCILYIYYVYTLFNLTLHIFAV